MLRSETVVLEARICSGECFSSTRAGLTLATTRGSPFPAATLLMWWGLLPRGRVDNGFVAIIFFGYLLLQSIKIFVHLEVEDIKKY